MGASILSNAQQLPNDPATRVGKLDNGLTYYIHHNDKPAQRAEFYLATDAGAVLENPDQDGLAHFLEHMCFNGTKNFPGKSLLNWLESIGASFGGNVNAGTGIDQTVYMLTNMPLIRPTVVDSCLLVMHDYSHFVLCEPEEIEAERGVILEEKRTRSDASWRLREAVYPALLGDTKYATTTIIGSEENLKTFKPESLSSFYHTWYRPDTQALIVVGDVDVDEVEAKIKTIFADIPASENPTPRPVYEIPEHSEPRAFVYTDPEMSTNNIEVYYKFKPVPKEMRSSVQAVVFDIAKSLISSILNERLGDLAVDPASPFHNASYGFGSMVRTCDIAVLSMVQKDGKALESLASGLVELKKAKLYGFTDSEVERAKSEYLSRLEAAAKAAETRKNSQFVYPMINNFLDGEPFMTPETTLQLASQILPQLSAQALTQIAAQFITNENMVVVEFGVQREGVSHPTEAQMLEVVAAVDAMQIERPAGEEIPESFLDASKLKGSKAGKPSAGLYGSSIYTLKNGARIVLLPTQHEKNRINFSLAKRGGLSLIPEQDLASFETNILNAYINSTGVAEFPRTTVSKMLAGKQLSIAPKIGELNHSISGNTTSGDLETALQLLYLYFTAPRFDPTEYAQGIDMLATQLPNLESTPDWAFNKAIQNTVYAGKRHPLLSKEVLEKANLQTIEKYYRSLFNDVAGATFYMAGDFKIEEVLPLIQKYLGSLPKGKKAQTFADNGPIFVSGAVSNEFAIPMQNPKVSIFYLFSQNADYSVEAEVDNEALYYILSMTYTNTLRESEGGTYGAQVAGQVNQAPFSVRYIQVACDTNVDQQKRLRELIREGVNNLAVNGPSAEDFDKAKKNLEKNIPESKLRNAYWLQALVQKDYYGYDYVSDYQKAVETITAERIQKAAAELIASGNVVEIVMLPESK